MRGWLVVALVCSSLAGCGSGSDDASVRKAVHAWIDAVANHDGAAACAHLSSELHRRIARHLLGEGVKGGCNTWAARFVSPRHPASHRDARITAIRIHDAHARVSLAAPSTPSGWATLLKERGHWLIDNY